MFAILYLSLLVIAVLGLFYLFTRFHRFFLLRKVAGERKWAGWMLAAVPVLVLLIFFFNDAAAATACTLHLMFFWFVCDLTGLIIKKISGRVWQYYWQGVAALGITVVYLSFGWYFAHHVYETRYIVEASKDIGQDELRIALLADAHIGSTFDGDGFAGYMQAVQQVSPDLVAVAGDFVDDDTTRADMEKACRALGGLQTTYGVYYVFGNHDKGYYDERGFSADELRQELTDNKVQILEDETVLLNDQIYLIGRQDRSVRDRLPAAELTKDLDTSEYIIILDHQPNDYEAEEAAGADLVLSGHTHGGQLFPIGITGELSGANDKTYGQEKRGNTEFIVTSGISNWAVPFKTAAIAEYVVIDVKSGVKIKTMS